MLLALYEFVTNPLFVIFTSMGTYLAGMQGLLNWYDKGIKR
jgi:hypothetical protein